jgi:hypothetical protein
MSRKRFQSDEDTVVFIPIKKGRNPKRFERDEDFARKQKRPVRRDRRTTDFLENAGW